MSTKLCENCQKEHDGSFGSGRFCSSKCSHSFSTLNQFLNIKNMIIVYKNLVTPPSAALGSVN